MTARTLQVAVAGRGIPVRTTRGAGDRPSFFPSVGEYGAYDAAAYDTFSIPGSRNSAYLKAIRQLSPGRTVVDIGTGRDALWAVAAARAGARHVYAVEAHPGVAACARAAVSRSGVCAAVTVIEGSSHEVSLPELAEVCVSEIIGNISSAEGITGVLGDAASRLCSPDCRWIPQECQTHIAAVSMRDYLGTSGYAVAEETLPYLERIYQESGRPFDVRMCVAGPVTQAIISSSAVLERLFPGAAMHAESSTSAVLAVTAAGQPLTGLVLWTRARCSPDGAVIDALDLGERAWAPVYAPLSLTGIPVIPGDTVGIRFRRALSDDGIHPDYHLAVQITRSGEPVATGEWSSAHHGHCFRATDFYRQLFP